MHGDAEIGGVADRDAADGQIGGAVVLDGESMIDGRCDNSTVKIRVVGQTRGGVAVDNLGGVAQNGYLRGTAPGSIPVHRAEGKSVVIGSGNALNREPEGLSSRRSIQTDKKCPILVTLSIAGQVYDLIRQPCDC